MTDQQIPPSMDLDQARSKFALEREKRMKADGMGQYVEVSGEMAQDPWTEYEDRAPVMDHVKFTFVGAGWAGLTCGAELAKAGIKDVRIIDRAGDFGGVWYWNRYPGLMCDSPALMYLPYLEETGHVPTMKYVYQPEILDQIQKIAKHFDLYDKALFHTEVTSAEWIEAKQHWLIKTNRGDVFTSDYFSMGLGFLSTPKLPGIKGVETFKGKSFHAARWDYDYTGGEPGSRDLPNLRDKKVAVIGTGATAIQIVGPVAENARETFVFQRTPSAVWPRGNEDFDPEWFKSIAKPGWQEEWQKNYVLNWSGMWGQPFRMAPVPNLLQDVFSTFAEAMKTAIQAVPPDQMTPENIMASIERADVDTVAMVHAMVDQLVHDPETAAKLKPWYRPLCKRPTFNDDFLPSFNRPNTHLIDTDGQGVTEITEKGIVANGIEYEVDVIIYASGYTFAKGATNAVNFPVIGADGRRLQDHWKDGLRSLHGMHVNGFPNMFVVQLAQGADFIPAISVGWQKCGQTIATVVGHMQAQGHDRVEAKAEDEAAWSTIIATAPPVPDTSDCTPGLLSHEGETDPRIASLSGSPDGPRAFFAMMESWKANGRFEGLSFGKAA